ncbi:MAG: hypothetical protein AAGC46_10130 [Solirubrobacteraceae bacterium]|nr:hypothetical protein [Patulibacter sp.]
MNHQQSLAVVLEESSLAQDVVTGTLAPSAFRRAVNAWITGGSARRLPSSSLLLVRVDGEQPADRATAAFNLRTVAELAGLCLHTHDIIGRVDSHTVGILLPSTPKLQAEQLSRRVRASISEGSRLAGAPMTASVGISSELLGQPWVDAAAAVAEAQAAGGDRTVVATPQVEELRRAA